MYNRTFYKLYRYKQFRRLVLALSRRTEGGEFYSETLRKIFADYHQIEVGEYSYGCFVPGNINAFTRIGRYCSIAEGVCIFNGNHPLDRLSGHPFFYSPNLGYVKEERIERRWIEIGHDVWIGRNALVTPSVRRIGNGVVVGAGAVVTRDIPDFAVVAGNPASHFRYRFDAELIKRINKTQWWAKSVQENVSRIEDFENSLQGTSKT